MKQNFIVIMVGLGLLLNTQFALAQAKVWELDKAHSNFYFSVDHIFSKVNGHFNDFTTEVKFDPKNLDSSSFYFEIKTASIDTNIAKRDKHLQSDDFFSAGKHALMTFKSEKIIDSGDNVYQVSGKFTVKGEAYDLVLPVKLEGIKAHPAVKGKDVIGFNSRITIDRLAYGVGSGKFFDYGVVGKDVEVFISLELLSDQ